MTIQQGGPFDGFEIISAYPDSQAIEDGALVDLSGERLVSDNPAQRHGARVTASVFATFRELAGPRSDSEADADELARIACGFLFRAILRKPADADGWRKTEARKDGESIGPVWLIPNEVGGLTLMFPSDY
jgi:hypothetical protein